MSGSSLETSGGEVFTHTPVTAILPAARPAKAVAWITAIVSTLLVAGELAAIDAGLAISIRGSLHLGQQAEYIILAVGGLACLWTMYVFFRAALRYERNAAHGEPPRIP